MKKFSRINKKKLKIVIPLTLFLVGLFVLSKPALAGPVDVMVSSVVGFIASIVIGVFGAIISVVIKAILQLASYNNFVNEKQIIDAWIIIRDLCNMFFVLILLVIAFATILRLPNYEWKKLLPKLLIMAVLINFSRTICGLIIDFAQVIMLTFVNGFQDGGGNFIETLGVQKYLSLAKNNTTWSLGSDFNLSSAVIGMLVAVLFLVIAGITLLAVLGVLAMRLVMLWIYVILSPFAFLAAAFPAGQKYASQWWSEFSKNVIVGPVLAFFVWLALMASQSLNLNFGAEGQSTCFGPAQIMCVNDFLNYVIAIGMLFGGLMVTQQIGGAAASIAGKSLDWSKKIAGAPLAAAGLATGWAAKGLFFKAGRMADEWQMRGQKALGLEFPKSMNYRMIAAGWKADREKKMADYESGVLTKTGPLQTMWQETFNKHLEFKQYGAWRKSRSRRKKDLEEKKNLEAHNVDLENMISSGRLSPAMKAEAEARMAENKEEMKKLEDPRWLKFGLSAEKARPYDYVLSKAGDKEREDKEKKAMEARTQSRSFAVNSELIKAFHGKEDDKLASAFKILAQNNDLNEALKDSRIIDIMTRQNGILEKMAKKGTFGEWGKEFKAEDLKALQEDYSKNPVSPANAQALVRGMMEEIGVDKKKAARISNDIGECSYTAGNGLLFGSAMGNSDTGDFEFEKLAFNNGRLQSSEARKAAIAGKYTNVEAQQKMRTLHPDLFLAQNPNGAGTGLTEDGAYFLENSLHGNDLTQLNRLRSDVVKKIANSPGALRDIKALVDRLEAGTTAQKQQAAHIKYFAGYILQKMRKSDNKDQGEVMKAYNEFMS